VTPSLTKLELYLTEAEMKVLQELRNLCSHALKDSGSTKELILWAAQKVLTKEKVSRGITEKREVKKESPFESFTPSTASIVRARTGSLQAPKEATVTVPEGHDASSVAKAIQGRDSSSEVHPSREAENRAENEEFRNRPSLPIGSESFQVVVENDGGESPISLNRSIPQKLRRRIWQRDKGVCTECGSAYRLEIDHVQRFRHGGSSQEEVNLRLLCQNCNLAREVA
jgi:hypothetical protein